MKIGILIPTTTKNTKFKRLEDTHLFKFCLPSLCNTLSNDHQYTIYYGIDDDDKIYNKLQTKKKLINSKLYDKIHKIKIYNMTSEAGEKGNVVKIWNELFEKAYDDNNDYFIQMGDDILFHNKNWINPCLEILQSKMNIGVCAPLDINNPRILTQSIVSRKHMEIFGYYFNPKIKNWGCDDWITGVYSKLFAEQTQQKIQNKGGNPRYNPDNNRELWDKLIKKDKFKLKDYINNCCN